MSVIQNNLLMTPEGYQISRSVRLRSSASAYFNRTPASAGNRTTWTLSGWVKRGIVGSGTYKQLFQAGSSTARDSFFFDVDAPDTLMWYGGAGYGAAYGVRSLAVFRDPAAWYHIVWSADTTQATAANRLKLYVNGVQQTLTTAVGSGFLPQNTSMYVNAATLTTIGSNAGASEYFDGYLTEVNFIDGQALTPSSFGETDAVTGVWKPKKYTGTYGTNGFYLNFSDNSAATAAAIGKDSSGNGNNWTPNNISVTAGVTYDSMLDVPTMWADGGNGRGNYCVMNPLTRPVGAGGAFSVAQGNLQCAMSYIGPDSTIAMSSGKWYWEVQPTGGTAAYNPRIGIVPSNHGTYSGCSVGDSSGTYGYTAATGNKGSGGTYSAYGATYTDNDIIGVALDMDSGTLTFYKNGASQGTAYTGLTGEFFASAGSGGTGGGLTLQWNFGQRPFTYTPPTGFKALNTQNLPDATIKKGSSAMNTVLVTGTGSNQSITGYGFAPDFVWLKKRSAIEDHKLFDTVRGAINRLASNTTGAETTDNDLYGFTADGFDGSLDAAATYAAWGWKKGATQGFDIVTYTGDGIAGRTVAHSLGVKPAMMLIKKRIGDSSSNWMAWHQALTTSLGYLNLANSFDTSRYSWALNSTQPTSSNITVGSDSNVNANTHTYVAYLFAEVAGFSKFGSFTGNGSTDGPFIFAGFKPRFVMVKRTDSTSDWYMWDTARDTYDVMSATLLADTSGAETSTASIDTLSNGFKCRSSTVVNASGGTYIYAAFATNPFKNSLAS